MNKQKHWENVYQTKAHDEVSWFRERLATSLRMIEKTGVGKNAAIINVGGGNATLVDDLFEPGFMDLSHGYFHECDRCEQRWPERLIKVKIGRGLDGKFPPKFPRN